MPPLKSVAAKKSTATVNTENAGSKMINTRSSKILPNSIVKKENAKEGGPKRKAVTPIKGNTLKRSALVNITNAIETQCIITSGKKNVKKTVSTVTKHTIATAAKQSLSALNSTDCLLQKPMPPPLPKSRLSKPALQAKAPAVNPRPSVGRPSLKPVPSTSALLKPVATAVTDKPPVPSRSVVRQSPSVSKKPATAPVVPVTKCKLTVKPKCMVSNVPNTRRSSSGRRSTMDSTDSSLYESALSDIFNDSEQTPAVKEVTPLPKPKINIDEEYINDPYQCATYAYEIFEYLKSREAHFRIKDYMDTQPSMNQHVRAVLIDWMVELQENFELNHETLYLGVKLLDTYLSRTKVPKISLQLVGATSLFIAAKFDERVPPAIEDFLYVCDGVYKRKDMLKTEVNILQVIRFELGYPLSYRFLRRYARCAKVAMPLLTLARYILELTLMDYSTISISDSKMAAAALYLSFKMKKEHEWDDTLIYFSGYRVKDFIEIAHILNNSLHQKPRQSLSTVRNKYSHQIFFEVAKIPLISNEEL